MISDDDRQRVVTQLTRHCGDGRLTLDELEDRVGEVYAATTVAELRHALRELPSFRVEEPVSTREPVEVVDHGRRARLAPAHRCGMVGVAGAGFFLIPLIVILFVTAHVVLGTLLLVFCLPKHLTRRTLVRA